MATVLVVDDHPGMRQLARMILEQKGYVVLSASNGVEALMVYASYHSRFDVVLVTDVNMPQMGGIELAARIHAMDPSKRVVLMTGSILEEVPEYCTMLTKPFQPDELTAAVEGVRKG
jgi:two-component system cell cycle sensor histidine kinase/response regulator CckA